MIDLQKTAKNVTSIVAEVGSFIRNERTQFDITKVEFKGVHDLVSYVDKTAEQQLVKQLQIILPEAGFITEESTIQKDLQRDFQWVIDPLDGTTNFVHGLYPYAISIALMQKGKVILGVVYEIGADEMFMATIGNGSFCNGKRLLIRKPVALDNALIATGFPTTQYAYIDTYLQILKTFMEQAQGVRRMGSAATDLAYLAAERFDGFFEFGLSPWDVAAGSLIVAEAEGKVTDMAKGNDYIFGKNIIAANPKIMDEMQQIIINNKK